MEKPSWNTPSHNSTTERWQAVPFPFSQKPSVEFRKVELKNSRNKPRNRKGFLVNSDGFESPWRVSLLWQTVNPSVLLLVVPGSYFRASLAFIRLIHSSIDLPPLHSHPEEKNHTVPWSEVENPSGWEMVFRWVI